MKYHIIILVFFALLGSAFGACGGGSPTWTAATCGTTDVAACITAASTGDTINIPAGSCGWSSGVTLSGKALKFVGAGSGRIIAKDNSVENLTIGTGALTVLIGTAPDGGYSPNFSGSNISNGQTLRISRSNSRANWMQGTVTSLTGNTLVMNITSTGGSGTAHQWLISTVPSTIITNNSATALFDLTADTSLHTSWSGIKIANGSGVGLNLSLHYTSGGQAFLIHDCWIEQGASDSIDSTTNQYIIYQCSFDGSTNNNGQLATTSAFRTKGAPDAWTSASKWGSLDTTHQANSYVETNDFHDMQALTDMDDNSMNVFRYNLVDESSYSTHGADTSNYGQKFFEYYNNYGFFHGYNDGTTMNVANGWIGLMRGGTYVVHDNTLPVISSTDYATKSDILMIVMNLRRAGGPDSCWGSGTHTAGQFYYAPRQPGFGYVTGTGHTNYPAGGCNNCTNDSITYVGDSEPAYIWANSRQPLTNVGVADFSPDGCTTSDTAANYLQINRDFFNSGTAKPGYTPAAYPNPLEASGPLTSYNPVSLAFGNQIVNTTSGTQTITLTNSGATNLVTTAIALQTGTQFSIDGSSTCVLGGQTLAAAASCTIVLKFTPTTTGAKSDTVNVTSNAPSSVDHLALTGTGVQAATGYAPTGLVFGNQVTNTTSSPQTVTLTNTGTSNLITTNIALQTGTQFAITGASTCNLGGQTLAPSANCTIVVTFTPTTNGAKSDNVRVTSNAPTSVDSVSLTGTGITGGGQAATPVLSPSGGIVPQVVTATTSSSGTVILCWAGAPTTPVTNGAGTACSVGTAIANGGTVVMSAANTLNVVAGTSTLTDSAVANGVYTGSTPGLYNPLIIAWQAPQPSDTTNFNNFVLNILPHLNGIGISSTTATQNNLGNVYWSDLDNCFTISPCASEATYAWPDTFIMAYVNATVGSNGTFANGCAGGTACKIIIRIAPQQDSGTGVTKTPPYVMSTAYAASLGVPPQDVSYATAWPGAVSGTWPGTVPCTNITTANDACIVNATPSCTAYGAAVCGTVHGPPDAAQNLSGFPVVYEVPIMTAYQKFITALFLHYSAGGTAPGPTIAPYISSVAIGMAAGSENNPGNVGSGSASSPVPGPGGVLTHTFWPCPSGLAACPAAFNQCGYLTTWTGASVNGMSCPATLGGDGYVTLMNKFFATLNTNGITISQSSHGGPPSNQNTFNVPGTAPYADAEALIASQANTGFIGFGQQSERLSDISAYAAGSATTQDWVVNFSRFKAAVRHLITINDGGANPHAAEFGISSIGSCSAGVCTVNCSGSNGNSCEVFGDGATILITNNANPNYNGMQVIDCSGTCPAGKIKIDSSDASGGAGGQLWSPSYLPLLLPFASQHQASYVGVWECDLDYTYGTTTANFTSPCGGNPGPDTAWQNAIINFENGTPTSTSAIKGTAACKGHCASF